MVLAYHDDSSKMVALNDLAEKWTFFYLPADFTSACPTKLVKTASLNWCSN